MNIDADVILKLLLPALFFAAWALNQIVNRESQGQARRAADSDPSGFDRSNPLGPRPVPPDRAGVVPNRPRVANATAPGPEVRAREDEILIIQSETLRPRMQGSPKSRKQANRGKAPGGSPRRGESDTKRVISNHLASDVTRGIEQTLQVRPLFDPATSLSSGGSISSEANAPVLGIGVILAPSLAEVRANLTDPRKIRQAVIVNEILRPPLALRRHAPRPGQGPSASTPGTDAAP
jgi:hypothetical protein